MGRIFVLGQTNRQDGWRFGRDYLQIVMAFLLQCVNEKRK
jgi:hypothetical protein